jgi:hypothetical protein
MSEHYARQIPISVTYNNLAKERRIHKLLQVGSTLLQRKHHQFRGLQKYRLHKTYAKEKQLSIFIFGFVPIFRGPINLGRP